MMMHGDAANANAFAKVLVRYWLSRWGVPDIITSDRGSQFVSDLWLEVCSLMGTARDPTTSYHTQHNGKIERMHRSLKNSRHWSFAVDFDHWSATHTTGSAGGTYTNNR